MADLQDLGKASLLLLLTNNSISASVLSAFAEIPREKFVPERHRSQAYQDDALPIGEGQTISQPSLVATMLDALDLHGIEKVLEIGTGSGYQTALLSTLAKQVYSIERLETLAHEARKRLRILKIKNAHVFIGDGSLGLSQHAPFDAIIVAAAFKIVPQPLVSQLKGDGRLVMPVGKRSSQEAVVYQKILGRLKEIQNLGPVRFVPFIGKEAWEEEN
ncbi:MAG: protein-L-isoaspartate(D-aspartate) O-methyltransferase [bacterium]|nr:protein-L-isoaspartate(D-aspartate) O-methyltransferase [bacterium]